MAQLVTDIRGVMIPLTQARVLLPNASVSEVITYGTPQEIENAPEWVFGVIQWRGWRIPLFSFSLLAGQAEKENLSGAKVAIIKALSGVAQMPYMALLAQGFPRLTQITEENLLLNGDQDDQPRGVAHTVIVNDDPAFVPNLDGIEKILLEVLEGRGDPDAPTPAPAAVEPPLTEEMLMDEDDQADPDVSEVAEAVPGLDDDGPLGVSLEDSLSLDDESGNDDSGNDDDDPLNIDLGMDLDLDMDLADADMGDDGVSVSDGAGVDLGDGLDLDDLDLDFIAGGTDDADDSGELDLDLEGLLDDDDDFSGDPTDDDSDDLDFDLGLDDDEP